MKMRKKALVFLLLILIFSLASCANQVSSLETDQSSIFQREEVRFCEITAESVEVKSGLGERYQTIATLHKGDRVTVLAQIRDWYVIRLDNNRLGAINANSARPLIPEEDEEGPTETDLVQEPEEPQDDVETEIDPIDSLSTMENRMVNLINEERRKNDLTPYRIDLKLAHVARIKAQDMVDNNYFSHYSPTYGSPFDMMKKYGIEYLTAGENISGNSSVERAHDSLMKSSGHRQNILNPQFNHIGIGIKPSKRYGYIFVQMFIGK
jgi:uncharacterized YkwD family protein